MGRNLFFVRETSVMMCTTCREEKPASSFNAESFTPDVCFRCRVSSIGFANPLKSAQGDDAWRHDTIKAFQRRQIAEAAENGYEAVPAWHKTNTGPSPAGLKKLQAKEAGKVKNGV